MKLPGDAVISADKLIRYLLAPRSRGDKSQWLALAGYTASNWQTLETDIREQLLPLDVLPEDMTPYGPMVVIRGDLVGPNGRVLRVRSCWMIETTTGQTKLITMFPDKERG